MFNKISILVLLSVLTPFTYAATAGKVTGLQFPTWVERGDQVIPLTPGQMVEEGDVIHTGEQGKLLLRMNDGSDIKLGNNSNIDIKTVSNSTPENENIFGLALNVLKGVFRFTTSTVAKKQRRNVAISFGTVTAGIRGTDIWGRTNQEKDLVCLLEGKIDVSHPQSETIRLDEPLQYYDALKGEPGALKGKVDAPQVQKWANLTDLDVGQGVMSEDGQWSVVVMSLENIEHANAFQQSLNSKGYPAIVKTSESQGQTYHRVMIQQLTTYKDAKSAQSKLNQLEGVNQAWIRKSVF